MLEALMFEDVDPAPRLYPSSKDMRNAAALLEATIRPVVLVHPGAREANHRWLPEAWAAAITDLAVASVTPILTGNPEEHGLCEQIAAMTQASPEIQTDLTLLEYAALASMADAVVVGDAAPMHIAAAMGTPVVALFGPTDPTISGPYGLKHRLIRGACPCPAGDRRQCTCACMRAIEPEIVVQAVLDVLSPQNR
jgi:heptosyltransferase-1